MENAIAVEDSGNIPSAIESDFFFNLRNIFYSHKFLTLFIIKMSMKSICIGAFLCCSGRHCFINFIVFQDLAKCHVTLMKILKYYILYCVALGVKKKK